MFQGGRSTQERKTKSINSVQIPNRRMHQELTTPKPQSSNFLTQDNMRHSQSSGGTGIIRIISESAQSNNQLETYNFHKRQKTTTHAFNEHLQSAPIKKKNPR